MGATVKRRRALQASRVESLLQRSAEGDMAEAEPATERVGRGADLSTWFAGILMWAGSSEVVPGLVEVEVAVPRLRPAVW
jgi:hypothetical protein